MSDGPEPAPDDVSAALTHLREAERGTQPSARTAALVMAAWDATHALSAPVVGSRPGRRVGQWWLPVAAAVCAALVGTLVGPRAPHAGTEVAMETGWTDALTAGVQVVDGPVQVVRLAVDVETLPEWGFTPAGAEQGPVALELYVGEDGVARAVRVSNTPDW